jgi:hypothetical protein
MWPVGSRRQTAFPDQKSSGQKVPGRSSEFEWLRVRLLRNGSYTQHLAKHIGGFQCAAFELVIPAAHFAKRTCEVQQALIKN